MRTKKKKKKRKEERKEEGKEEGKERKGKKKFYMKDKAFRKQLNILKIFFIVNNMNILN